MVAVLNSRSALCQFVEKGFGPFEVERVKAFGEPAVDRGEKFASLLRLPLIAPQPRHAHGPAQLPGLRLLLACSVS